MLESKVIENSEKIARLDERDKFIIDTLNDIKKSIGEIKKNIHEIRNVLVIATWMFRYRKPLWVGFISFIGFVLFQMGIDWRFWEH